MLDYPMIDWEIDVAGKYRVRLDIDGSTVMFKYNEMPSEEQLQQDAAAYVKMITFVDPAE